MRTPLSNLSSSILDYKRQGQAIFNRGSSVFALFFIREEKDTGFPITTVGNDKRGLCSYQNKKQWDILAGSAGKANSFNSHSSTDSRGQGIIIEIPIEIDHVASVSVPTQHCITEELSSTGQFLPTTLPAWILYGQVKQLQRPGESLFTVLRVFLFPTENAPDLTANVGQLLHQWQGEPSPSRQAGMLIGHADHSSTKR